MCGWNSSCGVEKVRKCFTWLITGLAHRPQKFLPRFQRGLNSEALTFRAAQTNPKKAVFWVEQREEKNPALSPKPVGSSPSATSCSALPHPASLLPQNLSWSHSLQSILISEGVALSLRMPYPFIWFYLFPLRDLKGSDRSLQSVQGRSCDFWLNKFRAVKWGGFFLFFPLPVSWGILFKECCRI